METEQIGTHGFVRLVGSYGDDARIVEAARVSYGNGTKTKREDQALINYLMRHEHMSPFEMVDFTFHIKAPIFIARQWFRHRTASVNEISARYSVMKDEFYEPQQLRGQSKTNKQGSEDAIIEDGFLVKEAYEHAYEYYEMLIADGVAREQARMVLPVGMYTEFYWKQNLRNLLHFIKLRIDGHAQQEIREYAEAIANMIWQVAPMAWEAFQEHHLNAVKFSRKEMHALRKLIMQSGVDFADLEKYKFTNGERQEFLAKLI